MEGGQCVWKWSAPISYNKFIRRKTERQRVIRERVPKKLTCELPQTLPSGFVLGPFCFHPKRERC